MENEKLFELMEKMYAEILEINEGVKDNTPKIDSIEKAVLRIEQNHGKKLEVLFDGYKQNAEQLSWIEREVSKCEEVILRRVN